MPNNPVDNILPLISEAVDAWQQQNSAEAIKKHIFKMLDKESEQIVYKLLGFDTDYSKEFRIDHCNGRNGNSAAGDYIRNAQRTAIQEWLSQIPMPVLSLSLKKQMKSEMDKVYKHTIFQEIGEMATAKAQKDMTELINKITPSQKIDSYVKAMQLLDPPNKE